MIPLISLLFLSVLLASPILAQYDPAESGYEVKKGKLDTDWTEKVRTNPWVEYPRPQQVRERWQSLNGIWRYSKALGPNEVDTPPFGQGEDFGQAVMIPSCIESALSGVMVDLKDNAYSWFQTKFTVPDDWRDDEILLNFGAVDYQATIWINGEKYYTHKGGYNRFTYSIAPHVKFGGQDNELLVFVHDPTDSAEYVIPVGKQTVNPSHIFYTACSGIWQSVFIEPVPKTYIDRIDLSGDMDGNGVITVHSSVSSPEEVKVALTDHKTGKVYESTGRSDGPMNFTVPGIQPWCPDNPTLYNVSVTLGDDKVDTYMGFRTISRDKVDDVTRPMLNGEFVFMFGPLDQGYWPDGIYTPPSYEAMKFDLKYLQKLGFNMVRKHIKVETDLFYRACDELGLLVIQDMVSTTARKEFRPNEKQQEQWESELKQMVDLHKSFPSIFTWVIYNEGWGQLDEGPEKELTPQVQEWDPTRLIDSVSGWNEKHKVGDFSDNHHYPEPNCGSLKVNDGPSVPYDPDRIGFQGEFGGLGLNASIENLWNDEAAIKSIEKTYELAKDKAGWNKRSREVLAVLQSQVEQHACSGGVWTQTTDVEGEVNGLMTYDRRVDRTDPEQWKSDIQALYDAAKARGAGTRIGATLGSGTKTFSESAQTASATSASSQTSTATSNGVRARKLVGISKRGRIRWFF
ncbi:hypothetical protein I316_04418 [Kwoniella heveanensis BCC8398]|uniref:Beta-galactosidase n=1 Tax=Kwoniella heveanensis BCC8398 TaxID=1296120 RepID=A0A1B9GSQ8_9TREE|nr:hypothetical protein I316_04418 [Kwoniella heveanensis BCC8398]